MNGWWKYVDLAGLFIFMIEMVFLFAMLLWYILIIEYIDMYFTGTVSAFALLLWFFFKSCSSLEGFGLEAEARMTTWHIMIPSDLEPDGSHSQDISEGKLEIKIFKYYKMFR